MGRKWGREFIRQKIEEGLKRPLPPKKSHQPACSNCGVSGHNKITCPIPVLAPKPNLLLALKKPPVKDLARIFTPELKKQAQKESAVNRDYWMQRKG